MAKETSGGQIAGNCLATIVIGFILLVVLGLPMVKGVLTVVDKVGNYVEARDE